MQREAEQRDGVNKAGETHGVLWQAMYTYDNICAAVHHFSCMRIQVEYCYVVCNRHRSAALYCMKILHIEAKPLTIWYSVMMILTDLSSGLTGNKIIQGFNFCWILVFLVLCCFTISAMTDSGGS